MTTFVTTGLAWGTNRIASLALTRSIGTITKPAVAVKVYRAVETPLPTDLEALLHLDVASSEGRTADGWWRASLVNEPSSNRTAHAALMEDQTLGFAYTKYRCALRTVDLTYPELITEVVTWARKQRAAAEHHFELLKTLRGGLVRAIIETVHLDPTRPSFRVAGNLGMAVQDCLVELAPTL